MTNFSRQPKATIVGLGLGGSLMAIYLARRGFDVQVYERRGDMRCEPVERGRSINMTLAARGLRALEEVGLLDTVMQMTLPLRGRLVHSMKGSVSFQPYGKNDCEVIHAVMRNELNMLLMNTAQSYPNVKFSFHERCIRLDKENSAVHLLDERTNELRWVSSDVIVGADGAFSMIRQQMHRGERAAYQQDFLDWGYKELTIPPGPNGSFQLDNRGLHIWPRGDAMLIAMPNYDGSFTCTCILPFEGQVSFASLTTPKAVRALFDSDFSDAVPLMPSLVEDFLRNPVAEMITTRTLPWRYKDRVVLLGDACHAVVPFYGQGMNAAFEDCRILDECLGRHPGNLEEAFSYYQELRKPNTDVLADLSKQNFVELRSKIRSPVFNARKKVDVLINKLFPRMWVPLYTMISHSTIPIADAVKICHRQHSIGRLFGVDLLLMMFTLAVIVTDLIGLLPFKRRKATLDREPLEREIIPIVEDESEFPPFLASALSAAEGRTDMDTPNSNFSRKGAIQ